MLKIGRALITGLFIANLVALTSASQTSSELAGSSLELEGLDYQDPELHITVWLTIEATNCNLDNYISTQSLDKEIYSSKNTHMAVTTDTPYNKQESSFQATTSREALGEEMDNKSITTKTKSDRPLESDEISAQHDTSTGKGHANSNANSLISNEVLQISSNLQSQESILQANSNIQTSERSHASSDLVNRKSSSVFNYPETSSLPTITVSSKDPITTSNRITSGYLPEALLLVSLISTTSSLSNPLPSLSDPSHISSSLSNDSLSSELISSKLSSSISALLSDSLVSSTVLQPTYTSFNNKSIYVSDYLKSGTEPEYNVSTSSNNLYSTNIGSLPSNSISRSSTLVSAPLNSMISNSTFSSVSVPNFTASSSNTTSIKKLLLNALLTQVEPSNSYFSSTEERSAATISEEISTTPTFVYYSEDSKILSENKTISDKVTATESQPKNETTSSFSYFSSSLQKQIYTETSSITLFTSSEIPRNSDISIIHGGTSLSPSISDSNISSSSESSPLATALNIQLGKNIEGANPYSTSKELTANIKLSTLSSLVISDSTISSSLQSSSNTVVSTTIIDVPYLQPTGGSSELTTTYLSSSGESSNTVSTETIIISSPLSTETSISEISTSETSSSASSSKTIPTISVLVSDPISSSASVCYITDITITDDITIWSTPTYTQTQTVYDTIYVTAA